MNGCSPSLTCRYCAQNMLVYDPQRRISAKDAMEHPYFEDLNAAVKNLRPEHM